MRAFLDDCFLRFWRAVPIRLGVAQKAEGRRRRGQPWSFGRMRRAYPKRKKRRRRKRNNTACNTERGGKKTTRRMTTTRRRSKTLLPISLSLSAVSSFRFSSFFCPSAFLLGSASKLGFFTPTTCSRLSSVLPRARDLNERTQFPPHSLRIISLSQARPRITHLLAPFIFSPPSSSSCFSSSCEH